MVGSFFQTCALKILRNFWKGNSYMLGPHAVALLATGYWSILRVFCPGRTRPLCCKQGNVITNTAELVPRLSVLRSYPYVVFISYLVHDLLISSLVLDMHTLSLGLNNECGNPKSRNRLATVRGWNTGWATLTTS